MPLPINATLTFKVGTGLFTADPETGNPIESSTNLVVKASLSQKKNSGGKSEVPGLNPSAIEVEGRAIYVLESNGAKNKSIPPLPTNAAIVFTDAATGQELRGAIVLDTVVQSKFKAVSKALGTKISGYFVEAGK